MTAPDRKPDIRGDFRRYPIPWLLFYLLKKRFLGQLEIFLDHQSQGSFYFRNGLPSYSDYASSRDVLGRVLLEQQLISEESYHRSLELLASGMQRQGEILLQLGALEQQDLIAGLRLQLQRKLTRLFSLPEGHFALYNGEHAFGKQGEETLLQIDPLRIIYHGVRHSFHEEQVNPELEKLGDQALQLRAGFDKIAHRFCFGDEEETLLQVLRQGPRLVSDILSCSPLGDLETRMVLYTLWISEALDVVAEQSSQQTQPAPQVRQGLLTAHEHPAVKIPRADTSHQPNMSKPSLGETNEHPTPSATPSRISADLPRLIAEMHQRMLQQNHFEVLGVEPTASPDAIRDAYFALAKIFHPDRCSTLGQAELTTQAAEIFRRINEAHAVLSDPMARKEYENSLKGEGHTTNEIQSVLQAEIAFQKGMVSFRKKRFSEALEHFNESCRLNAAEGEHLAWAAWSIFCNPKNNREAVLPQVKIKLLESCEISPRNATCHYFLGEMFLALGDERQAKDYFLKTLERQKDHLEATRHLRLMKMRKQRKDAKGKGTGLFSRLLKK